ncbi:GcrA cell cycle regulator [Candidatus Nomurabacteria bacterium]|nr:GcrA cell cycle regulator [Candidatus Nomurabacteria bacterium]
MSFWTVEHIETLRTLWKTGYSATQIEHHFNRECSRSAVLGKLRRLGLTRKTERVKLESSIYTAVSTKSDCRHKHSKRSSKSQSSSATTKEPEVEVIDEKIVVPVSKKIQIMELSERTCKWPIGDPLESSFCYCGNDTAKRPYCGYHAKLAFQPESGRRKRQG